MEFSEAIEDEELFQFLKLAAPKKETEKQVFFVVVASLLIEF